MPVAPPSPRLPSLNALRAFEAAARLGGFAQAAEELHVTPGAITALIKALESDLGAPLFVRQARGVALTDIGRRALPAFSQVFDRLGEAVRELRQDAAPRRVHLAALPAIAQLWLAPRLSGLRALVPDIEVSVTAMEKPPNLKRAPFDLCLFYAEDPPADALALAQDRLTPVCTPALARRITGPQDLASMVCLSDSVWAGDWARWAAVALPGQVFAPRGPVFSLYAIAVQEALNGAGVLIARQALVSPLLASGALVAPLEAVARVPVPLAAWSQAGAGRGRSSAQVLRALVQLA